MFGGYGEVTGVATGPLNDSWEWDGISGAWTETTPPGVKPLPRYNHIQIFDSLKATTLVFGGTRAAATAPTARRRSGSTSPTAAPRPNGSGCSAASAVDLRVRATASTASAARRRRPVRGHLPGLQRRRQARHLQRRPGGPPRRHLPERPGLRRQPASARQPLGHACNSFADCASGHCADGVCCNTDCNGTCKACNLNNSLGTCAQVPTGNEDPGTCTSDPMQARFCDASGVCTNGAKPQRQALHGRAASARAAICIDGFCCSSACATTCYSCGTAGLRSGAATPIADRPAGPQRDDDLRRQRCSTARRRHLRHEQEAERRHLHGGHRLRSGVLRRRRLLQQRLHGHLPGLQRPRQRRELRQRRRRRAGPELVAAPAPARSTATASGTCQSGLKANGIACAAGDGVRLGQLRRRLLLRRHVHGRLLACNLPGTGRHLLGRDGRRDRHQRRDGIPASRPTTARPTGRCTDWAQAERRDLHARRRVRLELTASTRPAARAVHREVS